MPIDVSTKMQNFYKRFNINKELTEKETYDLLCTRLKDSIKLFFEEHIDPAQKTQSVGIQKWIIEQLNDHYGNSIFEDNSEDYYIKCTINLIDLFEFIQLYVAIIEQLIRYKNVTAKSLKTLIDNINLDLEKCKVNVSLIKCKNGYTLITTGAKELDEKLVNDILTWLEGFDDSYNHFVVALTLYTNNGKKEDIVENLRKSIEFLLHKIFGNNKPLEKQIKEGDIKTYLLGKGIHEQIVNIFCNMINEYKGFANSYAKHGNGVKEQELEFLIYQTGVFLRMFLTLK